MVFLLLTNPWWIITVSVRPLNWWHFKTNNWTVVSDRDYYGHDLYVSLVLPSFRTSSHTLHFWWLVQLHTKHMSDWSTRVHLWNISLQVQPNGKSPSLSYRKWRWKRFSPTMGPLLCLLWFGVFKVECRKNKSKDKPSESSPFLWTVSAQYACVCAEPVVKVVETTALVSSPLAAWSLTVYSVVSASPSSRIHVSSASRISS